MLLLPDGAKLKRKLWNRLPKFEVQMHKDWR